MTTDIERQFFDTFGIEPKLNRPCEQLLQNKYCNENSGSRDTYFDPYPYCVGFENCAKDYKARVWVYPKITDRILLELICIFRQHEEMSYFTGVQELKKTLLADFIEYYDRKINAETYTWLIEDAKQIKHQVQALFEEVN